jgi:hypothetical protein
MSNKLNDIKGDSLSRLLQVRAAMHGVYMKWTGIAIPDLDLLCLEYFHRKALNECLWNGLRELMEMPELKELPEPVYAKILSIVLKSQANFELKRAETLQRPEPPTLPPPGVTA